jgi:hypothetical protein
MAYGDKPKKREKDDMGNKGRRGKGPKPMKGAKKARRESARQERNNLLTENPVVNRSNIQRFQGSTRPLGDTKAMNAMMKQTIEAGLAADLGTKLAKAASPSPEGSVNKLPSMSAPKIKKGFTPSVRTMELGEAHDMPAVGEMVKTALGSGPTPIKMSHSKAGGPIKPEVKKAKTKKVVDDMGNKGRKGKGPKKMKKKRVIKAKF